MKYKWLTLGKTINNIRRLLSMFLLLTFIFVSPIHAATYNYYFSDDDSGNAIGYDGNNCTTIGTACKTLTKAWQLIDAANSNDIVNLYFDQGDTWNFDTGQRVSWNVAATDPVVNIDDYGSEGSKPIFDGNITDGDFSVVPKHNDNNNYRFYRAAFQFKKAGCSMKDIELRNVYGNGVRVTSNFTCSGNTIHHIGYAAINKILEDKVTGVLIEKNLVYNIMELSKYKRFVDGQFTWGTCISMYCDGAGCGDVYNNTIRNNVLYDCYGEGIAAGGATIEHNIVGDTGSVAIYPVPSLNDAHDSVVRYNLVTMSSSPAYKGLTGSSYKGINVRDEHPNGDNSNATIQVYGNIVINRMFGILFEEKWGTSAFGEVRIFNNTVIDSEKGNLIIGHGYDMVAAGKGFFYNNLSILYDRTSATHAAFWDNDYPTDLSTYWKIDNNQFWTKGGSPYVDRNWQTNYVRTDPKLAGEEQGSPVDWDGQSGATYYKDITFAHVYPNADSGLVNTGKIISFEDTFLSNGSDFSVLPTTPTIVTKQQSHDGKWDIGAIIFSESTESKAIIKSPVGLDVVK